MRGEAENINMDLSIIDKVLDSGIPLNEVTFTGGEPSLYPEAITHFAEELIRRDRYISSFYVKSNGMVESLEMAVALLKLYSRCDEKDMCGLEISQDQFHTVAYHGELYPGLTFYRKEEYQERPERGIINEGLASWNGIGHRTPESSAIVFNEYDDISAEVEMIQIAANGNITGQCDISFDREDEEAVGNVLTDGFAEVINRVYEEWKVIDEEVA